MSTYGDLIAETQQYLYGFGADRDKVTSLKAAIKSDDLQFSVADGGQIDRGYIEIDDEIFEVAQVDRVSGLLTIHPFGRGAAGTTPAPHMSGSRVTNNPRFSRNRVKTEVNNAIRALYPDLFSVASYEFNANAAKVTYGLPANAEGVLSVSGETLGPSGMWRPVTRYRFDYLADSTAFPTGKTIDVLDPVAPGRKVKVIYKARTTAPVYDSETLSANGIEDDWRDLIRLKATSQLLLGLEPIRLNVESIESLARGDASQPAQAVQVSRQLMGMYQNRMAEEIRSLYRRYPTTAVRMR